MLLMLPQKSVLSTATTALTTKIDQWNEAVGSAKESAGSLLGNKELQQKGRDQAQEGQAQTAIGQATDWVQGSVDRLRGK